MTQPWMCPRCKRINAPFNPTCFCREDDFEPSVSSSGESSEHVADAMNYLMGAQSDKKPNESGRKFLNRKFEEAKTLAEKIAGLRNEDRTCLICGLVHNHGQHCATLQSNLPPNGEFI